MTSNWSSLRYFANLQYECVNVRGLFDLLMNTDRQRSQLKSVMNDPFAQASLGIALKLLVQG